LAVKKFGEKAGLQGLVKKILANVDLHRQSKINSKTKPNEAISNYSFARVHGQTTFLAHAGHYRL